MKGRSRFAYRQISRRVVNCNWVHPNDADACIENKTPAARVGRAAGVGAYSLLRNGGGSGAGGRVRAVVADDVGAVAAVDHLVAEAVGGLDGVVAVLAVEGVEAGAADEQVVAGAAE